MSPSASPQSRICPGGVITVDTASGRGMTLEIYLPRSDRPTTNEAPAEERVRGGSERILITEDETFLAYLWERKRRRR